MPIVIRAIRDDGVVLGQVSVDISDRDATLDATAELLNHIYETATDPLNMPRFTFVFG